MIILYRPGIKKLRPYFKKVLDYEMITTTSFTMSYL